MASNALPYQVGRMTGVCASTGQSIPVGAVCVATLCEREGDDGLERRDYSWAAWESGARPERLFSYWKMKNPQAHDRQRLLVDDDVLVNLFERLADDDRPQRVAFRFVLALILMRKRLLKYVGRGGEEADERWLFVMRPAASGTSLAGADAQPLEVRNPRLGDENVRQITEQLGEILQAEL